MKIIEIAFTGYPVTDLPRARHFYEKVLGLQTTHFFGDATTGWVEYDIGPGTLSIGNGAPEWKPAAGGGCVGLEVADMDEAAQTLQAAGVKFAPPFETPVCRMLLLQDPDGNSLMLHQRKAAPAQPAAGCCSCGT